MKYRIFLCFLIILFLLTGCSKQDQDNSSEYPTEYEVSPSPTIEQLHLPESPGEQVVQDASGYVQIDYSNTSQGYIQAKLLREPEKRMRLSISKDGVGNIAYDFTKVGEYETFPFDQGSGTYLIKVLENKSGKTYAITLSMNVEVQLENEQIAFLYPNQIIDYTADSKAIQKAFELTKKDDTVLKRIATLYNYVVDNITYDSDKAEEVQDIYVLPIIDETLESGTGICFDYAALLTAMLRSQNIPTRLITGNTTIEYHAWIEVYIEGKGWINPEILLNSKEWSRMDPTFDSSDVDYQDEYENKYYY